MRGGDGRKQEARTRRKRNLNGGGELGPVPPRQLGLPLAARSPPSSPARPRSRLAQPPEEGRPPAPARGISESPPPAPGCSRHAPGEDRLPRPRVPGLPRPRRSREAPDCLPEQREERSLARRCSLRAARQVSAGTGRGPGSGPKRQSRSRPQLGRPGKDSRARPYPEGRVPESPITRSVPSPGPPSARGSFKPKVIQMHVRKSQIWKGFALNVGVRTPRPLHPWRASAEATI